MFLVATIEKVLLPKVPVAVIRSRECLTTTRMATGEDTAAVDGFVMTTEILGQSKSVAMAGTVNDITLITA